MRLTLVIPSLTSGGAERVMTTLANAWAARGWRITLLTYDDGREAPFYDLHPDVDRRPLGLARNSRHALDGVRNNLRRGWVLRRAIAGSDPDVVVSFLVSTNVVVLAASAGLGVPVVVAERNDPSQEPVGRGWGTLRRWSYPRASRLVVLTRGAAAYFPPSVRRRTRVIPNPVVVDLDGDAEARNEAPERRDGRTLIAAGRLVEQKGFDRLLRAFAAVAPRHPTWSLEVWGDGPLRAPLEALRDELGAPRVRFPGRTTRLHRRMARADLFVLSSRYEGFPNVVCEAMACGLPVVSFDCPSGPAEIVRHAVDGLLVPPGDVAGLATALDRLMADEAERRALGARAPEVLSRFGLTPVLAAWDRLFAEVRRCG